MLLHDQLLLLDKVGMHEGLLNRSLTDRGSTLTNSRSVEGREKERTAWKASSRWFEMFSPRLMLETSPDISMVGCSPGRRDL